MPYSISFTALLVLHVLRHQSFSAQPSTDVACFLELGLYLRRCIHLSESCALEFLCRSKRTVWASLIATKSSSAASSDVLAQWFKFCVVQACLKETRCTLLHRLSCYVLHALARSRPDADR